MGSEVRVQILDSPSTLWDVWVLLLAAVRVGRGDVHETPAAQSGSGVNPADSEITGLTEESD